LVDFPWSVADGVYQHHERLSESSCQRKFSKAARSASRDAFRPLLLMRWPRIGVRAGLGLDVALREIEKGAGTTYDAAVVKACVKVFGEGGYQLLNRG